MCRRITTLLAMLAVLVVGVGGAAWVLVAPPSAKARFQGKTAA